MIRNIRSISALAAVTGLLLSAGVASAQDSTTGAIRGVVKDRANGEAVVGGTVVATSAALKGSQTVLTDGSGAYYISSLPPGMYEVAVYFVNKQFSRKNVLVRLGKISKVNVTVDSAAAGEEIVIEGRTTIVDQDSTKTGTTITQDYTDNIPTGRTFGGVLESGAGNQGDLYGISVGGSTSIENTYIVEGINTTDPGFGLQTTNLPNEFIRETEVITGGYEAEYGRSTGGVINVVTKAGSNDFHGSVFAYWTPGALTATADAIPREGEAVRFEDNLANAFDIGAELGGPIVKDKLWFHVGVNPSFTSDDIDRVIQRRVDADNDGVPDVNPDTGFEEFEELSRSQRDENFNQVYYTGKISGAVDQDHQGSLSVLGSPSAQKDFLIATAGQDSARTLDVDRNIFDVALKWTSKFNDSASQVDVVVGHHLDTIDQAGLGEAGEGRLIRYESGNDLVRFAGLDPDGVPAGCMGTIGEGAGAVPLCPVQFYSVGGVGFLEDTEASRTVASASFTQRVKAAGQHRFKVGADVELQGYNSDREFTGGGFFRDLQGFWRVRRFFAVNQDSTDPMATACGSDIDGDGVGEALCEPVDQAIADTSTRNIGLYAQDSWAILPNLTVNLGLRWEQQTLFTADQVQGQISPTTGAPIPDEAFSLSNMIAPRVGVTYDWTQEGRSKLFGHWGRFYESIPMDINVRAYGGEVLNIKFIAPCDTSAGDTGMGSLSNPTCDESTEFVNVLLGGGEELADPGLKAQFLDEIVLGAEYEVLPDFKVSANYVRRELGRVIEDVSTDGANTYVIANPGTVNEGAVADLRAEAEAERNAGNTARADQLDFQADQFANVGIFDEPVRRYNAMVLKADKRFSQNFFLQASYTYSQLDGNFPGLFSPETGQLDPNLTSMFDLPELMANRFGPLAADRPHLIKLDGYYSVPVENVGRFTIGGRIRGTSGLAVNTLGAHSLYGSGESYILPRGSGVDFVSASGEARTHQRTPFATRFDTHLAYKRALTDGVGLEAFVDIFNLFNQQPDVARSEIYTFDPVNPIVGGDGEDLQHLKVLGGDGLSTASNPTINPNFGNVTAKQAPLTMRLGVRLTF
jgi:outer membrane receptor protein involved in Fe transport